MTRDQHPYLCMRRGLSTKNCLIGEERAYSSCSSALGGRATGGKFCAPQNSLELSSHISAGTRSVSLLERLTESRSS